MGSYEQTKKRSELACCQAWKACRLHICCCHDGPQRPDGCPQDRPSSSERRASGLIVQGHLAGRRDGSDQHLPGERGHLRQHHRDPDSDRLHCRTRTNASAADPASSLGKNWNPTEARPLSGNSTLSKPLRTGKKLKRSQPGQLRPRTRAGRTDGKD